VETTALLIPTLDRITRMNERHYSHAADDVVALGNTAGAAYPAGASVYDTVGELLGTVSGQQDLAGYLVVHTGRLLRRDIAIPEKVIDQCDGISVYLRVRRDMLKMIHRNIAVATAALPMILDEDAGEQDSLRTGHTDD
jgi:hypothetical protein